MTRALAVLLLLSACTTAPAPTRNAAEVGGATQAIVLNGELRDELLAMRAADQEVRGRWIKDQKNAQLNDEMNAIDAKHVARLRQIIDVYGWPGKSLVGPKASGGAWMIAQHGGKEFLSYTIPLMRNAVAKGELDGGLYATSVDRARVQAGQQQVYGSQFDTEGGKCDPMPIEDAANVDARRKEVGLGPLSEYAQQLCTLYKKK